MDIAESNEFAIARSYTDTIEYDCVSLEKLSDPSNLLEESSHPPRRAGTRALQGPLSLPDKAYNPVPATISLCLFLPNELVERILLLLDAKSVLKCRLINTEFNAIIQSSTLVQYYLACKAAGVIDNPQSPLSYAERREALKKREDAWRKLKPVFEMTIKLIDQPSTLYELRAGNYFLCDSNWNDLYYCHLPSFPQDNPQCIRIPGPEKCWSGSIVGMGMAIYEHDLIINIICHSEVGNQAHKQRHSFDLILLKFSTGEYHPLARHARLHVQRSPSTRPFTSVKVVGDSLALVVDDRNDSRLLIFDWKTGHKRLQHKATENAYEGSIPIFVSPELLLVPNLIHSHFEIWHLFPSHPNPSPPVQILSLQIPVSLDYSIFRIYCHGELDPFPHSIPYFPPRPFFPSSENSIIIVNITFEESFPRLRSAYTLVMHRHAILDMIQKWTSPSCLEKQEDLPTWFANEVTVHKLSDPDDGWVRLSARSELVSTMLHPRSSSQTRDSPTLATSEISSIPATSHVSADSGSPPISSGSTSATSRPNILQVQWADWGPPISRWIQVNETHSWRITQSYGQRCVVCNHNPRDKKKYMVGVADFNPHNVRVNMETMAQLRGKGMDDGSTGNDEKGKKEEEWEILDHEGELLQEMWMGLKCVVYHTPGEYDFEAVLMDEERVLGLKLDDEDKVESIKVLYFG